MQIDYLPFSHRHEARGFGSLLAFIVIFSLGGFSGLLGSPPEPSPTPLRDIKLIWKEGYSEIVDLESLRAGFREYLASPSVPMAAAEERRSLLLQASRQLGGSIPSPQDLGKTCLTLQQLAADPLDGNRCRELLRSVMKVSLLLSMQKKPDDTEVALRRKREILSWNMQIERKQNEEMQSDAGPASKEPKYSPSPPSALVRQLAETDQDLAQIGLDREVGKLQAGLELQDLALRFMTRGDYGEAILAVRFYRGLFDEAIPALRLGEDAKLQVAPPGSNPTLGAIETISTLTLRSVSDELANCSTFVEGGSTVQASERLLKAFAQGSRTLEVLSYPDRLKKKVLHQLELEESVEQLVAKKDYAGALAGLDEIGESATDFNGTAIRASIEAEKSLASVHLAEARKAGREGRTNTIIQELKQCETIWPKNPELPQLFKEFDDNVEMRRASVEEFDQLFARHEIQEIERQRYRFEPAIDTIPVKHGQLIKALDEAEQIREGMGRARQLRDCGSLVASWELVESLCRQYPEQTELIEFEKAFLPGIEPLAEGLMTAQALEKTAPVKALQLYLSLQRSYPKSALAAEGVGRLSSFLLDSMQGGMKPGSSPMPKFD